MVGLRRDGTVVSCGLANYQLKKSGDWKDIVAIDADYGILVGLQSDGTVVAIGTNAFGECEVSDWTDIRTP